MKICSANECDKAVHAKGFCGSHYKRLTRHGDPLKGPVARGVPMAFFMEALTSKSEECIPWPYAKRGAGRGAIQWDGKTQKVHRVMCAQFRGEPPTELHHAAHECGNGHLGCINPNHLFWKTPKENSEDMNKHGTSGRGGPRRKFSADYIKELRKTMSPMEISRFLPLDPKLVYAYLRE